jgi:beta-glucosidase
LLWESLEQGFRMSYTSFACKDLTLPHEISSGERLGLGVEIRNTGKRDGADVIQVYVAGPSSAGEPPKQLKGFAKVANETRRGQARHADFRG